MPRIVDCCINELTKKRALELVPPEFAQAYKWFEDHQDIPIKRLPMGADAPFSFAITREAGIHSPDYRQLDSHGAGKEKYALSIHSQGQQCYDNKKVVERPDGTWILEYKAQVTHGEKRHHDLFNVEMMNCLRDGIPIGVMVKTDDGYLVKGLAFIENYNGFLDAFTIHGPVRGENDNKGLFTRIDPTEYTKSEKKIISSISQSDERKYAYYEQVRRERQDSFRSELMRAYGGMCAATGIDIPEVLQAAHIDPYRGVKSQNVRNGVLFRADIHLLFDAQLLAIQPETHRIVFSEYLANSRYYRKLCSDQIRLPQDSRDNPDEGLLELHYRGFESLNPSIA